MKCKTVTSRPPIKCPYCPVDAPLFVPRTPWQVVCGNAACIKAKNRKVSREYYCKPNHVQYRRAYKQIKAEKRKSQRKSQLPITQCRFCPTMFVKVDSRMVTCGELDCKNANRREHNRLNINRRSLNRKLNKKNVRCRFCPAMFATRNFRQVTCGSLQCKRAWKKVWCDSDRRFHRSGPTQVAIQLIDAVNQFLQDNSQ
jgi:hypothetical protein